MRFKIFYGDGSTFVGEPEEAPTRDVQAIAMDDPNKGVEGCGRIVLYEWDIYIYSDRVGSWHGTNKYYDLLQHLEMGCGKGGVRAVLTGAWIDFERYREIRNRAINDPDLSAKSATKPAFEDGSL